MTIFCREREKIKAAEEAVRLRYAGQLAESNRQVQMYQDLWTSEKTRANVGRDELRALNLAMQRKNRSIKRLIERLNERKLVISDVNDQLAQVFHNAKDADFVQRHVATMREDMKLYVGAGHEEAYAEQERLFPELDAPPEPNGICNDLSVPVDKW